MNKRKGIIVTMILTALFTIIMPFQRIKAEYSWTAESAPAFIFWSKYGFSEFQASSIYNGSLGQFAINGYYTDVTNVADSQVTLNVYNSNGGWLGYYTSSSGNTIYYHNGSNNGNCTTGCYIAYNFASYDSTTGQPINLNTSTASLYLSEVGNSWIPYMTNNSNTFPTINGYSAAEHFYYQNDIGIESEDYVILSFIIYGQAITTAYKPVVYERYGNLTFTVYRPYSQGGGSGSDQYLLYTYAIKADQEHTQSFEATIGFPSLAGKTNVKITPIYFGSYKNISEDLARMIGIEKGVEYILLEGNDESQQSVSDLDSTTSQFNTATNQYHTTEQNLINDFDSKLNNITLNNDLITNNNFLTSANWVRSQFNNMINNNPFGSMIYFSLSLGLALVIIGKLRS